MQPTPYNPEHIPSTWADLGMIFDGIVICNINTKNKTPDVFSFYDSKSHHSEEILDLLNIEEKNHIAGIESAIAVIALSGGVELDGLDHTTISWVRHRAETVASYIDTLSVNEQSIFKLPTKNFHDCVIWLMVDWWEAYGKQLAIDIHISDKNNQ